MSKYSLLNNTPSPESLKVRQKYSLGGKVSVAEQRVREWYEHWEGKVYVAFSGGKDSTVLLHIARKLYPDIQGCYVDTGLEFPEIRAFVKTVPNIVWVKPSLSFNKVIEKYGYPVITKEQSQYIHQFRVAKSEKTKHTRWYGNKWKRGKISEKWKYMLNAPFKISDKCCDVMKKKPAYIYEKQTGFHPILGTMAAESDKRVQEYTRFGCNSFETKRPTSKPLSIWKDEDIWKYLKHFQVPYSKVYDMGYERTGCMFCAFGCHLEKESRFELMKKTHPKQYAYCMEKLGMEEVLNWYVNGYDDLAGL